MDFAQQMAMDRIDKAILDLLQRDASLGVADLAEKVGLSKAPCWRRIRRLQERGVIRGTVALLDPKLLNVGTTVFVTIKTANHSEAWYERFLQTLDSIPEVVEIYRMSGDVDYLLRVVVPDIEGYGAVYYGDKDKLVVWVGDGQVYTEKKAVEFQKPAGGVDVPKSPRFDHHEDWFEGIKTGRKTIMNIEGAVATAFLCVLGNLSLIVGRKLAWDPVKQEIVGDEAARRLMSRPQRHPYVL